ncbi:Alpha/Beta hydrolase protein [Chytridium lagenaria]|nr:Alpha/Beta hydrolase protein [Chytridium lagenaria]
MTILEQALAYAAKNPLITAFLTIYTLISIIQALRLRKPKPDPASLVEVKLGDAKPVSFQIHRTQVTKPLPKDYKGAKLPLVVFESQIGYSLECWGYLQKVLEDTLPTLSYNHLGYGGSSAPPSAKQAPPRDSAELANELHELLKTLGLIGKIKDGFPPLIVVGHSFGGLVARAFAASHNPPNLIGIVLADSIPLNLLNDHPQLSDFLTARLPRVLKTASLLADNGFMHILSFFGVTMIPAGGQMAKKLSRKQINAIKMGSCDTTCLLAMKREIEGIKGSLDVITQLEKKKGKSAIVLKGKGVGATSQGLAVAVVTVDKVDNRGRILRFRMSRGRRNGMSIKRRLQI